MKFISLKFSTQALMLAAFVLTASCADKEVASRDNSHSSGGRGSLNESAEDSANKPPRIDRAEDDTLDQVFAFARKQQVEKVDYQITLSFVKNSETYKADTTMDLKLRFIDRPLSIDLMTKSVDQVLVNGQEIKDFKVKLGSLEIPPRDLAAQSKIQIKTTNVYAKAGEGIQSMIDPVDKAEYIYTDLEPYGAHNVFPCLDQPDLKGTYRIAIDAPSDWRGLSNAMAEKTLVTGARTLTTFAPTTPISSYLVFVGAGPYVEYKDQLESLPLTLNVRKSLAKYVDKKTIFDISKKGLAFFSNYFGTPYPFSKFGMVFGPDFNQGGMENPGNIVFTEGVIYKGVVSDAQKANLENLILHEMAHMWFGDLVTMKWWNDLWLNESFASYMAAMATDKALNDPTAWVQFSSEKNWGAWQDQLVTTHPIEAPIPDTRSASGNFDGITYGKGAAVLKQLHFFVGDENFQKGLKQYFSKFAHSNSERKDFVSELAKASGKNLDEWTKAWLQTAGPNRISVNWSCGPDSKINKFELNQTPNATGVLSPHRTRVGLYQAGKLIKEQEVAYSADKTQVDSLKGAACPDFVFANVGDEDYALFEIDPVSLKQIKAGLSGGFADPLMRSQIWSALDQMIIDLKMTPDEFFAMTLPALATEKNPAVLDRMIGKHGIVRDVFFGDLTPAKRKEFASKLEAIYWARHNEIQFFDGYSVIATTSPAQLNLKMFLDEAGLPKGMKLDQERRWRMITTMARDNYPGIRGIIATEGKRDPTSDGKVNAQAALIAIPDLAEKKKFFVDLLDTSKTPIAAVREEAMQFHSVDHPELSQVFVQDYFSRLKNMDWTANDSLVGLYFGPLFPHVICSEDLLKKSEQGLSEALHMTAHAKHGWLEANDLLSKCIAIRKHSK